MQVTGLDTVANGNPVNLFFGGIYGKPTVDLSSSVVASYGTGQTFNTIIVNDLSELFSDSIANQRAADNAILSCVANSSGSASQFGVTAFDGHATIMQALAQAGANLSSLQTVISGLNTRVIRRAISRRLMPRNSRLSSVAPGSPWWRRRSQRSVPFMPAFAQR